MRKIKVITKRSNGRNTVSTAVCGANTGISISHIMVRPNVKRSLRSTAALL